MPLPDFYTLTSLHTDGASTLEASVEIHPEHPIFGGHFPGQPVVPGVCMLQLITDCLEQALGQPWQLREAASLKYLTVLVPEAGRALTVRASFAAAAPGLRVSSASLSAGTDFFLKLSNAHYQPAA